jgi:hypothetical protein
MISLRKSVDFDQRAIAVEQTYPSNDPVPGTISDHQPKSRKEKAVSNISNNF